MSAPVLMIALDAAEPRLIERWMAEGHLPHLARLRAEGAYGRLTSSAEWLAGSPWPTFYTGTSPGEHGFYHFLQWRAELMAMSRPMADWLPIRPFWRDATSRQRRVVAIDMPATYAPEPFNGVEICGWGTHDRLGPPASHPPGLLGEIRRQFDPALISDEVSSPERPRALLRQRDELIRTTRTGADLAAALMRREAWDLFMVAFGATHRGGHKLWDHTGSRGDVAPRTREEISVALRQVYAACDEAVGRLVEAAGRDVTLLVVSLHGMGPNTSRVDLLPEMLSRILGGGGGSEEEPRPEGLLKRLRGRVPVEWRQAVKSRLPLRLQDQLTSFWRVGDLDLAATPAFSVVGDLQGYIRINLKHRESRGVVEPGEPYDRLCEEIAAGLASFVDADTGEPIARQVVRSDRLHPRGRRRAELPDLLVRWSSEPACRHRAVVSPRHGSIPWPVPGRHPDGRSGNHRGEGFLIARGESIRPSSELEGGDILDLAPSLHARLGLPPLPEWSGRVLLPVAGG